MKKWMPIAAVAMLVWNLWLTVQLIQVRNEVPSFSESSGVTVVQNTINGYTTDITQTVQDAKSKTVSIIIQGETTTQTFSGFIYSQNNGVTNIVTNASLVNPEAQILVQFDNGITIPGTLIGSDPQTDCAILQVQPEFTTIAFTMGDSDLLKQGEYTIALGGSDLTTQSGAVSFGVVSLPAQFVRAGKEGETSDWIISVLETDNTVSTSNTGGPLLNLSGEVVGLLSRSLAGITTGTNMGFALSSDELKLVADQLIENGTVTRGYLGVVGKDIAQMTVYQKNSQNIPLDVTTGIFVTYVAEDSPAQQAGIVPGDIVQGFLGQDMDQTKDLRHALYQCTPGQEATVILLREGNTTQVSVTLE